MTTIAALQGDGFAIIGFDSRLTREDGGRVYTLPKGNGKVVRNGEYLIGAAGDLRAVNLLSDVIKLPSTEGVTGAKLDKFFSQKVIPVIRGCFEMNGYGKDGSHESEILIAVQGQVYEVGSNYDWNKDVSGVYGIGSGGDYAVGALHAVVEKDFSIDEGKNFIKLAIEISAKLDSGTGLPIHLIVQEQK